MPLPRSLALALAVSLAPSLLVAQQLRPYCRPDSSLRVDTTVTVLGVRVVNHADSLLDLDGTMILGAAIRDRFVAPATLSRIFYPGTSFTTTRPGEGLDPRRVRHAVIELTLDSTGTLVRLAPRLVSADPVTDSLLMDALRQASSAGELRRAGAGATRELDVHLMAADDPRGMEPLVRVRAAVTLIDRGVRVLRAPMPRYPRGQLARGSSGVVRLRYVVGENGRAERNSIRVLGASDAAFIPPSIAAIEEAEYEPAQAGGCPVKALVEQNVRYAVTER